MKEPFFGVDVKRRRLLGMERTQAFVCPADFLQRHVILHDLQDVGLKAEVVDERLRKESHS